MRVKRDAAIFFVVLSSFGANGVAPSQSELAAMYDKAAGELGASDYAAALQQLDAIDVRQPDLAETQNLRGVVLMREGKYDRAEAALQKALEIEPKFFHARFNLAEIPFLKKNWREARDRFDALLESSPGETEGAMLPLIHYKILLVVLFQEKEEELGTLLSKLKGWKQSPAFGYAEAAIAFHHHQLEKGRGWMAAAEKDFPAEENKLFLESFYELGWLPRPAGESRAVAEFTSLGEREARSRADAQANFAQAKSAFQARDFDRALQFLDRAGGAPDQATAGNLRAGILLEQNKFEEAEAVLRKAEAADPAGWEAKYLLARISLRKKKYEEARVRFEALLQEPVGALNNESAQLIKYQIFLAFLLEGKESAAQQRMDQFKFTDDTPALYYAQAAWSFQHHNPKQARTWVASASQLFSPALNAAFVNPLADLGWFGEPPPGAATANDSAPSPSPAQVSFPSPADASPVPVVAESRITPAPGSIPKASPSATPLVQESDPAPAVSASAKMKRSDRAANNFAGEKKKRPRAQGAKATVAKAQASPAAKTKARGSRARPAVLPTPALAPAPAPPAQPNATPRPPFLDRLARTLLRPFKKRPRGAEESHSDQPSDSLPARKEERGLERSGPEN